MLQKCQYAVRQITFCFCFVSAFGAGVSGYSVPGVNNGYKGECLKKISFTSLVMNFAHKHIFNFCFSVCVAFGGGHGSFPGAEFGNGYGEAV